MVNINSLIPLIVSAIIATTPVAPIDTTNSGSFTNDIDFIVEHYMETYDFLGASKHLDNYKIEIVFDNGQYHIGVYEYTEKQILFPGDGYYIIDGDEVYWYYNLEGPGSESQQIIRIK